MLVPRDSLPMDWAKMDLSESEHSCDSIGSADESFSKLWGSETCMTKGLKDGALAGLTELVHDKDVAAKAVAFVVNSSRRGIVPLCADVASILRSKLRLERTIERQRKEIERLKNGGGGTNGSSLSGRTSRSTSPTHPLYEGQLLSRHSSLRLKNPGASPQLSSLCSVRSSPRSPSPPLPNSLEASSASFGSLDPALAAPVPHPPLPPSEGLREHQQTPLLPNQHLVTAEVHQVPSTVSLQDSLDTSHSHSEKTMSVETQCCPVGEETRSLQQQYEEVCEARAALKRELSELRQELEQVRLGSKVATEARRSGEESGVCEVEIENETSPTQFLKRLRSHSIQGVSELPHPPPSPCHHQTQSPSLPPIPSPQISPRNSDLSKISRPKDSNEGSNTSQNFLNLTVRLEDHVLIKGERTGYIKYIGHLERSTSPSTMYVGLHLDAPVGKHDGMVHGRRYFWCPKNHGIFVPVHDVMSVINRKPSKRPKTAASRRSSSSHGGGALGGVFPTLHGQGGEVKRTSRPGQAKRLISADSSALQASQKNRDPYGQHAL